jgi:hypothetical protein
MCWSGAQTGLSHCSLYRSAGKRASMSLLVLQLFISGFRGSDECLVASRAKEPCNLADLMLTTRSLWRPRFATPVPLGAPLRSSTGGRMDVPSALRRN